jgi:hypothetical protein
MVLTAAVSSLFALVLVTIAEVTTAAPSVDWTTILAAYGVASPLVIWLIRETGKKDDRITHLEQRNQELTDAAIDKIVPTLQQTALSLQESREELKAAAQERERAIAMIGELSGRVNPETLWRIQQLLSSVEQHLDKERPHEG